MGDLCRIGKLEKSTLVDSGGWKKMSNLKVVVEKHEGVTRVTINEEGEWSLLMNDVNGACVHVRCFGGVSYYVYEDDDGFTYSIRPLPVRRRR